MVASTAGVATSTGVNRAVVGFTLVERGVRWHPQDPEHRCRTRWRERPAALAPIALLVEHPETATAGPEARCLQGFRWWRWQGDGSRHRNLRPSGYEGGVVRTALDRLMPFPLVPQGFRALRRTRPYRLVTPISTGSGGNLARRRDAATNTEQGRSETIGILRSAGRARWSGRFPAVTSRNRADELVGDGGVTSAQPANLIVPT